MKKETIGIVSSLAIASTLWALPQADQGYAWECIEELSDEFKNTTLDSNKWVDYHLWWDGRTPCMFKGENVSVANGNLRLKTTTTVNSIPSDALTNEDWMTGACISGRSAFPWGYTEASIRGSSLKTIHGYWLQGRGYSEIDIAENFGHPDNPFAGIHRMNSIHFVTNSTGKWTDTKDAPGEANVSNPTSQYHTYGAWFNGSKSVKFYLDGSNVYEANNPGVNNAGIDFNEPMSMFLDTESFAASDWISSVDEYLDSIADLKDSAKNIMYCDWVRSYWQIPTDGQLIRNHSFESAGLPEWTSWGSGSSIAQISSDSKSGSSAIQVTEFGGAMQKILVQPNVNYELTAWVKCSAGSSALLWIENAETKKKIASSVITSTGWTRSSVIFKTDNRNMLITVSLVNAKAGKNTKFDLVRLTPSDYRLWNRGFESGTLGQFWEITQGSVSLSDYDNSWWAPTSGKYAVTLQGSPAGIRQIVNVNPNRIYRLTANIIGGNLDDGVLDRVYLGVKNFGGTEKCVLAQTDSYDEYKIEFTTGSDAHTAEIYLYKPTQTETYGDASTADDFKLVDITDE